MKRRFYIAGLLILLPFASAFSQTLNKVVASKHGNGKPEVVYLYKGETNPENLVKQEKYAADGKKVMEKNYLSGSLNGPALEWKEFDGTKMAELNYESGKLSGKQMYFFSDGSPKLELNYTAGRLDGRQVEYWFKKSLDSLKSEHNYSGGILHGMQRQWWKDGQSIYNLNFVAGKPDGLQRIWDAEGKMTQEMWRQGNFDEPLQNWTASQAKHVRQYEYKAEGDSLNVKLGRSLQKEVWYFETGSMEALTTIGDHPETQVFYLGGALKGKGKGTFDKKEGKWEFWHPNGAKMMTGEYKNGAAVGLFESWDENGKLTSEEFWNPNGSGRETWKVYTYHSTGAKESEGALDTFGHKKGKWKYWYANGNKLKEEEWEMTCSTGKGRPFASNISQWDDSGRLIAKGSESEELRYTYFPNGNPQEVNRVAFSQRNPCAAGPVDVYADGKFSEEVPAGPDYTKSVILEKFSFYENGDTMRVDRYNIEGKRNGNQVAWFSDGKQQYAYHYQNGNVQGSVKEWYPTGQLMIDHKYSTVGGTPILQEGIYYTDKGKDYSYNVADGKKKKAMEEIDAVCYFLKFVQENK